MRGWGWNLSHPIAGQRLSRESINEQRRKHDPEESKWDKRQSKNSETRPKGIVELPHSGCQRNNSEQRHDESADEQRHKRFEELFQVAEVAGRYEPKRHHGADKQQEQPPVYTTRHYFRLRASRADSKRHAVRRTLLFLGHRRLLPARRRFAFKHVPLDPLPPKTNPDHPDERHES